MPIPAAIAEREVGQGAHEPFTFAALGASDDTVESCLRPSEDGR
jgi:hypothetical protein